MTRLILFLVRCKLGLRKHEPFQFVNQRSLTAWYFFDNACVWKMFPSKNGSITFVPSNVSINWLLNKECKIRTQLGI